MSEAVVGRFAPSATGPLHAGSIYSALISYLEAKSRGGQWLLRIEDIDTSRCRREYADAILHTLEAFGFEWDGEVVYQSQRSEFYQAALEALQAEVFSCRCTRKNLQHASRNAHGIHYPGTCRDQTGIQVNKVIRIRLPDKRLCVTDAQCGEVCQNLAEDFGDTILRRADGVYSYHLGVVVDDAAQGISHIVRGQDLLTQSCLHRYLQQRLQLPEPNYLHHDLIRDQDGNKLSKQQGAEAVDPAQASTWLQHHLSRLRLHGDDFENTMPPRQLLAQATARYSTGLFEKA